MIFVSWRLCINTCKPDVNITLHLVRLKMEPDKEQIFVTFVFTKRKVLMHTELYVKRMVKMLYLLERIGLNDFENSDFDINDKKCFGYPVEEDEL